MLDFGLTPQIFQSEFLEKAPRVQRAALKDAGFEWRDLDEMLHHIEPSDVGFQLFQNGLVPQNRYTDDGLVMGLRRRRLVKRSFYTYLRSGATLVINRLEQQSAAMQALCNAVASFSGQPATGNGYVSFGGSGTFGRHWDTHDVFAIQLIGRKRWQIFEPTQPLPLSHQTSSGKPHPPAARPVLDVELETGDLLYIPRGWWHEVIPGDAGSFHYSVGTYGPSVLDYLLWVCSRQLPQQLAARQGLNTMASGRRDIEAALTALSAAALDPAKIADFQRELAERERIPTPFDTRLFLEPRGTDALNDETELSLNGRVTVTGDTLELIVNGSVLRMEGLGRAIVMLFTQSASLSLCRLAEKLPGVPGEKLRSTILELATHEALTIRVR